MTYRPEKAAQTIAYFAIREGGSISVLKAIKLLYLADRESIRVRGHPIQDESRFSLPYGPVNSTTLDHLNGAYKENRAVWNAILADRANNNVGLTNGGLRQEDLDFLSIRELEILETVWQLVGNLDRFDLADWTHDPENVPEWENPNGSNRKIPLERVMAAVGLSRSIERAKEQNSLRQAQGILDSL